MSLRRSFEALQHLDTVSQKEWGEPMGKNNFQDNMWDVFPFYNVT